MTSQVVCRTLTRMRIFHGSERDGYIKGVFAAFSGLERYPAVTDSIFYQNRHHTSIVLHTLYSLAY